MAPYAPSLSKRRSICPPCLSPFNPLLSASPSPVYPAPPFLCSTTQSPLPVHLHLPPRKSSVHWRMVSSGLVTVWPLTRGCVKISKSLPPWCSTDKHAHREDAVRGNEVGKTWPRPRVDARKTQTHRGARKEKHAHTYGIYQIRNGPLYLEGLVPEEVHLVELVLLQEAQAEGLVPALPPHTRFHHNFSVSLRPPITHHIYRQSVTHGFRPFSMHASVSATLGKTSKEICPPME